MNLAIFVFQAIEIDNSGSFMIVMLVILGLVTAIIMCALWWGRPKLHRIHQYARYVAGSTETAQNPPSGD